MRDEYRGLGCIIIGLIVCFLGGCAGLDNTVEMTRVLRARGVGFIEKAEREMGEPAARWDTVVEATAQGLAPESAEGDIQRRLMAIEAATCRAMAMLAENVRGTHVAKKSEVRDMEFVGEDVWTEMAGSLEGVKIAKSEYDEETGVAVVTVRVGLDTEGNIIPDRMLPITPLSSAARRVRAEGAARVDAVASLREQLGEIYVGQVVKVKDLVLIHQKAWLLVEGMLDRVQFSRPEWVSPTQCVVEATLVVTPELMEKLRAAASLPAAQ